MKTRTIEQFHRIDIRLELIGKDVDRVRTAFRDNNHDLMLNYIQEIEQHIAAVRYYLTKDQ